MQVNRLIEYAGFIDQMGGIEEAAKALGVEPEVIERAFAGLESYQDAADMNYGLASLQKDQALAADYGVDLNEVKDRIEALDFMNQALIDDELMTSFVQSFVAGKIDYEDIQNEGYDFFYNLTLLQAREVLQYIADHDGSAQGFANAYRAQMEATGSIYSAKGGEGSLFFEYLRSIGLDGSG